MALGSRGLRPRYRRQARVAGTRDRPRRFRRGGAAISTQSVSECSASFRMNARACGTPGAARAGRRCAVSVWREKCEVRWTDLGSRVGEPQRYGLVVREAEPRANSLSAEPVGTISRRGARATNPSRAFPQPHCRYILLSFHRAPARPRQICNSPHHSS